ncbi:MAG: ThuA domain-containing protein [Lentisphaeria bacterium]|nr:ThuA domain-containing protein [Lentisphaeria bacterium]
MIKLLYLFSFVFCSVYAAEVDKLNVLFLGGGGGNPDSGHNGRINHLRLKPEFARANIEMIFSSQWDDLNDNNLKNYDAVLMYQEPRGVFNKPERLRALINYVENGGGFVAIHNTCGNFDNNEEFVQLVGGQFARHGKGWFTAQHVHGQEGHPALGGVEEFEVFDETFELKDLNEDRIDLMFLEENGKKIPWTWIRKQGKGRVFYTSYGHDIRSWENFGFQKLITAATIWVSQKNPKPNMDIPRLSYKTDSEDHIHNFEKRKGHQMIQDYLTPQESAKTLFLPEGFSAQLIAHEPDIMNPIDATWDDQGRMYVAVTLDYPQIRENGRDYIVMCEDTDSDGKMDKFTRFADGFSLLTGMCWVNGGIILAQAPDMYFLKDTTGDGKADVRKKINTGWGIGDLHGGPSNLKYGFDNKIYGCVGGGGHYDKDGNRFSAGIWRMDVDGSNFEAISNLGDNSWGFAISEDNELFASSANKGPAKHVHVPYPYFEAVGLKKVPSNPIFDFHTFYPVTITRQGDQFGSYTAGSGLDLYTARTFPKTFWNRAAFIGGPTGKLLGQFNIEPDRKGSYIARNAESFVASFDEHTAPIQGKTGPDGNLYMLDWSNLIMLHGGEIQSPYRDHSHGRIYRITHKDGKPSALLNLKGADSATLVATLNNENMFWRMMAQSKLVQEKRMDAIPDLIEIAKDKGVDQIGLNTAVIHALWTLHGLGQMDGSNAEALAVAQTALKHRSAAVRKNALRLLPVNAETSELLVLMLDDQDENVLRHVFLQLSLMPVSGNVGEKVYAMQKRVSGKRTLIDAYNLALVRHGSNLVEQFIAATPKRNRGEEVADKKEVKLKNLLINPSFENVNEKGQPIKWISKVHRPKAVMRSDDSVARTGKYSARVDSTVGGGAEYLQIPRLEPGQYLLSAWVKLKDVKDGNGVLLRVAGKSVKEVRSQALSGTVDEWQKLQLNFNVNADEGILIFLLFGAWDTSTGTVWFDDAELYQLSSSKVKKKIMSIESLLAKPAFEKGADDIIRITELVNQHSEKRSNLFMQGIEDVTNIPFTDAQIKRLTKLSADASPKNKMSLALFAHGNKIDIGLSELVKDLKPFEVEVLEGDPENGKTYSASCVICHEKDFSGHVPERAPSLSQLQDWYLQGQMQKFKHGLRGYDVTDSDGSAMKSLMENYTHQQMADMVAYIKSFQAKPQKITLGGDPEKGKVLYTNCMACHGVNGSGNEALKSPNLTGLSDVYIVNQLKKYKNGQRGSGKGDTTGKVMQVSASILKSEQEMKDIAAYITTLKVLQEIKEEQK